MRKSSLILAALLLAGCVDQSGVKPARPKPDVIAKDSIEQLAFESFQRRDAIRATKLRALKGTKYDVKRQDAIAEAGKEAAEESWQPVKEALAKKLDAIPASDQTAFDSVLESLARAAERASK